MDEISKQTASFVSWLRSNMTQFNFYRVHLLVFVVSILTSSAIFWASSTSLHHVAFVDALTTCASAMTNCGLTTIDLSTVNTYQQSILFVLMALGDLSIASISIVWVRRHYFKKKIHNLLRKSKAARRLADDIEEQRRNHNAKHPESEATASSSAGPRQGLDHSESVSSGVEVSSYETKQRTRSSHRRQGIKSGYGGFPAPWETSIFRKLVKFSSHGFHPDLAPHDHHYLSFSPELDNRGRLHNLTSDQLEEIGGVEYRALGLLRWLLPAYTMCWLCLSWIVLVPYTTLTSVSRTIQTSQPGNTNPQWWAVFVGLSSYSNTGLNLLDQNMIPLNHDYLILMFIGVTVLAGNTFYPIFLRLTIWSISKAIPKHSELHHSLAFLLHHPRRCYLFLFPGKNTWYLFGAQMLIFCLLWVAFEVLNLGFKPLLSHFGSDGQRAMDGLFQSLGVRSSGFYITNQSNLSPGCQVFFMINMYISAIPFIISLRSTNIYEERSIGKDDEKEKQPGDSSPKGLSSRDGDGPSIQTHLQNQLAYDLWWLVLGVFFIAIIERDPLADLVPGFSLWSIIFEVVSAYGTVGLSLGLPYASTSFCGAWHVLSKLILVAVMLRGRHRILPLAIDRAVLIPGQDLMEKIDEEDMLQPSKDRQAVLRRYEEEIRQEEEGGQAEYGGRQDPEHSDGMQASSGNTSASSMQQPHHKQ